MAWNSRVAEIRKNESRPADQQRDGWRKKTTSAAKTKRVENQEISAQGVAGWKNKEVVGKGSRDKPGVRAVTLNHILAQA